jgi:hypothetical protein
MTNALAISSVNTREQLVIQQQQLAEQLKQLQFQLYDKSASDVVAHINQLQLQKAKRNLLMLLQSLILRDGQSAAALTSQQYKQTRITARYECKRAAT